MSQSEKGSAAELASLVAGVTKVLAGDAGRLQDAAQALLSGLDSLDPTARSPISHLQESFVATAQCVLTIRAETERLRSITASG